MSSERQKQAARKTLKKARRAQHDRTKGSDNPSEAQGMSTADKDRLSSSQFAFRHARKEPLVDAGHVRNAIARFDQVEGVTDTERDDAWKRILAAARGFDVSVSASDWRDLPRRGSTH